MCINAGVVRDAGGVRPVQGLRRGEALQSRAKAALAIRYDALGEKDNPDNTFGVQSRAKIEARLSTLEGRELGRSAGSAKGKPKIEVYDKDRKKGAGGLITAAKTYNPASDSTIGKILYSVPEEATEQKKDKKKKKKTEEDTTMMVVDTNGFAGKGKESGKKEKKKKKKDMAGDSEVKNKESIEADAGENKNKKKRKHSEEDQEEGEQPSNKKDKKMKEKKK